MESLTPQLISAGSIRLNYPTSKAADEHFENLRQQYAETITKMRNLCDEATDSGDFIKASEEQMKKHTFLCEEAIKNRQPQKMVDNTSAIARLANRVLLRAKQESDNSEDPNFIEDVGRASDALQNSKLLHLFLFLLYIPINRIFLSLPFHFFLFFLYRCSYNGTRCQTCCNQSSGYSSSFQMERIQ